jgi:hypothetical protein
MKDIFEFLILTVFVVGRFQVKVCIFFSRNFPKLNAKFQGTQVDVLSFKKMPETDTNMVNFGTVRYRKLGKNRFAFEGDFELFRNIGSELEVSRIIIENSS